MIIVGMTILVMISPGPDMVIVARNTLTGTRLNGLITSLGVLGGNIVHITYCIVGVGSLISQSIMAFSILKILGAVYLFYLGYKSFTSKVVSFDEIKMSQKSSTKNSFMQGFLSNILNPKGTLFYLGIFTVVIDPLTSKGQMFVLVLTMVSISAIFWAVFVLTLDTKVARGFLEKSHKVVNKVFGVLLIGLGIKVALIDK